MAPLDTSGQARHLSEKGVGVWFAGSALVWLADSSLSVPYRLAGLSGLGKKPCSQYHQRMAKWQTGSRAGDPCQGPTGSKQEQLSRVGLPAPPLHSPSTWLHHSLAPAPPHNPCSAGCHRPSHKTWQGFCGEVSMSLEMLSHWYCLLKSWTVWCEYR